MAKAGDAGGHRGHERRRGELEGDSEVPVWPPRWTKPAIGQPGDGGPISVQRVHPRGRVIEPVTADVGIDPENHAGIAQTPRHERQTSNAMIKNESTVMPVPMRFSSGVSKRNSTSRSPGPGSRSMKPTASF